MTHHLLPEVDRAALAPLRHALPDPRPARAARAPTPRCAAEPTLDGPRAAPAGRRSSRRFGGPVVDSPRPAGRTRAARSARALRGARRRVRRPAMLAWPAGPRDSDGVWAPHWYASVWTSTGFAPYRPPNAEPLPAHLEPLLDRCLPYYERAGDRYRHHSPEEIPMLQTFDERNRDLIVNVGGRLAHRDEARGQPVRLGRAGRRRGLGGAAAVRRADLPAGRAPRPAARARPARWRSPQIPSDEEITERDPPHAGRQRDARRRAHPAHADPRRQDHQRHGPAAQPVRPDADRAGRAQAAGLRRGRHHADHRERAPRRRRTASTRRSTTTT